MKQCVTRAVRAAASARSGRWPRDASVRRSWSLSWLLAAAMLSSGGSAHAATIEHLDVERRDGRYQLVARAHLDATPESIYDVLVDYDDNAYGRISSVYKESRYLDPAADGTPMVYTRMEGCLWFYCMTLCRTERLQSDKPNWIRSAALPERSNFKHSTSEWELEPDGNGGTEMTFRIEMEPDFLVPPVIGPPILKRVLATGGERAVARIERLARMLDGRPVEFVQPPRAARDDTSDEPARTCDKLENTTADANG